MRRFLTMIMAVSAIFALYSCQEKTPAEELDGPTITWAGNENFGTVDVEEEMNVNLTIKAPAGIKSFTVDIKSEVLEPVLGAISSNGSTLDLINDTNLIEGLASMSQVPGYEGLADMPTGDELLNQTSVDFNISSLVPLILLLTQDDEEESIHEFTVNVTDNNAKSESKTCTFRCPAAETPEYAAPTAEWVGHSFDEPMELAAVMDVKINISAPAGFKEFTVTVESAPLNGMGISSIDMVNPGDMASVVSMILGSQDITTATTLNLDLSSLVPMILALNPENDSDHKFTFSVVDKAEQSLTETCTFHYTGVAASLTVDESSVNLWDNTVKLNVSGGATSVAYREKGTESWNPVTPDGNGEYIVAPVWNEGKNDAGLTVYTVEEGTGIFAGKTYEFQLDGETVADAELTTATGDVIPNGDMSGWTMKDGDLPYPNAEGESFWDSGNNSFAKLCQQDPEGVAYLKANMVLGSVFAPGNMYTGDFIMDGLTGTAKFGKVYAWTARPSALKVSYKANVGTIDQVGSSDPEGDSYKGSQDITRIYAVVVDWTAQHGVTSGLTSPAGMWDPAAVSSLDEGAIIGYASLDITASQTEFTDAEIPFVWYDTDAKPAEGNYSVVISCATSNRGDYLTGCSTNELWIDDFEWVY